MLLLGGVGDVRWVCAGPSADLACTNREDVPTAELRNFVGERSKWNVKQAEDGITGCHGSSDFHSVQPLGSNFPLRIVAISVSDVLLSCISRAAT